MRSSRPQTRRKRKAAPAALEGLVIDDQELPAGWAIASIGDIADVVRGITFPASAKKSELAEGLIACLRTANVQRHVDWDDLIYVHEDYVNSDEQLVRKDDLIMSTANSRELVGKLALVDDVPQPAAFGGFVTVIRPIGISPHYLLHVLRDPRAKERLIDSATQTTNIANISLGRLLPFLVALPPLSEQDRIVAAVGEALTLCDALEVAAHHREEQRARLVTSLAPLQ